MDFRAKPGIEITYIGATAVLHRLGIAQRAEDLSRKQPANRCSGS
ncbi:MAG: hypothetical protein AAFX53_09425 [Bacteroidota bacterium]